MPVVRNKIGPNGKPVVRDICGDIVPIDLDERDPKKVNDHIHVS